MLYMVVVNRKYLVPVNAYSSRDAERVLETSVCYGVNEIVAFDPVHESTKYKWAYDTCESISIDDMVIAANRYHAWLLRNYNDMLMRENGLQQLVASLESQLRRAKEDLRMERYNAEVYRKQNGLQRGMTPMNEIMELEKLI